MLIFNKDKKYELVKNNDKFTEKDKEAIKHLFDFASKIDFGKVGRSEMYKCGESTAPRCTAVLQMDGTKAGALMEWAKRETVAKMKDMLQVFTDKPLRVEDIEEIAVKSLGEADRQRDEAADKGTDAHDNIEHWLNGETYIDDERLKIFKDIWQKEGCELVCTEMPIFWRGLNGMGFGGRLDILAYKDGKYIIFDNKTSKSIHQGYALQTSAYKNAVEQMSIFTGHEIEISKVKIIHLPDMATLSESQLKAYKKLGNLVEVNNLEEAFAHFQVLLNQYYMRNNKYF